MQTARHGFDFRCRAGGPVVGSTRYLAIEAQHRRVENARAKASEERLQECHDRVRGAAYTGTPRDHG